MNNTRNQPTNWKTH